MPLAAIEAGVCIGAVTLGEMKGLASDEKVACEWDYRRWRAWVLV